MKKTMSAGLVAILSASALALTVLPASADFSAKDAMAVCMVHKSHKHCMAMTEAQLMEMMHCMGSQVHNNSCY